MPWHTKRIKLPDGRELSASRVWAITHPEQHKKIQDKYMATARGRILHTQSKERFLIKQLQDKIANRKAKEDSREQEK